MRCIISIKDYFARLGMCILLNEEGYNTISVRDEQQLNTALVNDSADAVIYQPDFSDDDSAVLAAIRSEHPAIVVIANILHDDLYGLRQCIHEDVHACIFSTDRFAELPAALHSTANGNRYYSHTIQEVMHLYHIRPGAQPLLAKRELQLLQYIGQKKNNAAIARLLYCSEHTVEAIRKKMMAKINTSNIAELIFHTVMYGYMRLHDIK